MSTKDKTKSITIRIIEEKPLLADPIEYEEKNMISRAEAKKTREGKILRKTKTESEKK